LKKLVIEKTISQKIKLKFEARNGQGAFAKISIRVIHAEMNFSVNFAPKQAFPTETSCKNLGQLRWLFQNFSLSAALKKSLSKTTERRNKNAPKFHFFPAGSFQNFKPKVGVF